MSLCKHSNLSLLSLELSAVASKTFIFGNTVVDNFVSNGVSEVLKERPPCAANIHLW